MAAQSLLVDVYIALVGMGSISPLFKERSGVWGLVMTLPRVRRPSGGGGKSKFGARK